MLTIEEREQMDGYVVHVSCLQHEEVEHQFCPVTHQKNLTNNLYILYETIDKCVYMSQGDKNKRTERDCLSLHLFVVICMHVCVCVLVVLDRQQSEV